MREIKFRGIAKETNGWVHGSLIQCGISGKEYIFPEGNDANESDKVGQEGCLPIFTYEIYSETRGQYTGKEDTKDKEMYEGDIVECISWNEFFSQNGKPLEKLRRKMEIVFHNGGFKMKELMPCNLPPNYWDLICNGDIEIIGNIHDNPELLEEVKE